MTFYLDAKTIKQWKEKSVIHYTYSINKENSNVKGYFNKKINKVFEFFNHIYSIEYILSLILCIFICSASIGISCFIFTVISVSSESVTAIDVFIIFCLIILIILTFFSSYITLKEFSDN